MPITRTLAPVVLLFGAAAAAAHNNPDSIHEADPHTTNPSPDASATAARSVRSTPESAGLWCFRGDRRDAQAAYENRLGDAVSAERLRAYHDATAARPHRAGTEGDLALIAYLESQFAEMGLDVETQWLDLYLAKPVAAEVDLVVTRELPAFLLHLMPEIEKADPNDVQRIPLALREPAAHGDLGSSDPTLDSGWNAWSGTGEVTAEVVYANYGRKQDFERLKELGVDVTGKIVIARYGGNYRGYKAKFAEAHGAAGLIMYYDPEDVGYTRGLMYPEGGWANEHSIQRGSIITLDYEGDPLSPGFASVPGAPTLDPKDVPLPTIPVQPIGWGAAQQILGLMDGPVVPEEWQGGLPFNYRLTSGPDVQVRLKVEQAREKTRTANVLGTIRGAKHPEDFIVVGCHHDAWNHGASDPLAGMIVVLEAARVIAAEAKAGNPPDRSIVFAGWTAEEYGLFGSTEWVEANVDRLREHCIAYINLDMAAMGPNFSASASPSISRVIVHATQDVPSCADTEVAIFDGWSKRSAAAWPSIGTMGGGSDHVGFLCLTGVPCMGIGGGGSPGTSYHTNYDTLAWYRKVVGDDYGSATMVTRAVTTILARLANADVPPVDAADVLEETAHHLQDLEPLAARMGRADAVRGALTRAQAGLAGATAGRATLAEALERGAGDCSALTGAMRAVDRVWLGEGLADRPWYRSRFIAPDRDSGYASWPLPELRAALEDGDAAAFDAAMERLHQTLDQLELVQSAAMRAITAPTTP